MFKLLLLQQLKHCMHNLGILHIRHALISNSLPGTRKLTRIQEEPRISEQQFGNFQLQNEIVQVYLGRTFNEVKKRPLYVIGAYRPAATVGEKRRLIEDRPVESSPTVVSFDPPPARTHGEQPGG